MTKQQNYQKFIFEDYDLNREKGEIKMRFSFDDQLQFEEKVTFPTEGINWDKVNVKALKLALDNLHLIAGISYYKAYCPRQIELRSQQLNQEQAVFWNRIYERGLGEFFYQNQIDFRGLLAFPFSKEINEVKPEELSLTKRSLLPIGGGKDSLVSAGMLQRGSEDFTLISLRDAQPINDTAEIIGKLRLILNRELSPLLFELNDQGAYNGHVPITAYLSFLFVVCAILYDYQNIIFSLEKSADFGQLMYLGHDINHQYSKSYDFEEDLSDYLKAYVSPEIKVFSLLRPFYELRIAKIFSTSKDLDKFLEVFSSCNTNFKIKRDKGQTLWCRKCPKCAFVFAILAPFIDAGKLQAAFGENLFDADILLDTYRELIGIKDHKPFECVGTPEEMLVALNLASKMKAYKNTKVIQMFLKELAPQVERFDLMTEEVMKIHGSANIPQHFQTILYEFS